MLPSTTNDREQKVQRKEKNIKLKYFEISKQLDSRVVFVIDKAVTRFHI